MTNPATDRLIHRLATESERVRRMTSPARACLLIVSSTAAIGAAFLGPSAVVRGAWLSGIEGVCGYMPTVEEASVFLIITPRSVTYSM